MSRKNALWTILWGFDTIVMAVVVLTMPRAWPAYFILAYAATRTGSFLLFNGKWWF